MGTATEFCGADVGAVSTRDVVRSEGFELIVQQVSYGKVAVEAVLSGEAAAVECTATSDGRHYDRGGWCDCGSDAEEVRVERWSGRGREFHGWICGECRKLRQAG